MAEAEKISPQQVAAQGGPTNERSDMVAIAPTHDDVRANGGNSHLEDVSAPHFLTGDVTIPRATLFEAITRLAAYGEIFWRREESNPSIGMDDDGFTLGLLQEMTGEFPEDDTAYDQHPPLLAYEAAARDHAAALLRTASECGGYCILDVTDDELAHAATVLELDARRIRETGSIDGNEATRTADEFSALADRLERMLNERPAITPPAVDNERKDA